MLEVWNKVDLLPHGACDHPLAISCLTGQGIKQLIEVLEEKLRSIGGKTQQTVTYGLEKHDQVLKWLR